MHWLCRNFLLFSVIRLFGLFAREAGAKEACIYLPDDAYCECVDVFFQTLLGLAVLSSLALRQIQHFSLLVYLCV